MRERERDRCHLKLCNDLYMHQVGANRHFHLEQPLGSEMIDQPEMTDTKLGTLPATFDMCHVGSLKLPQQESYLQKRTQVFTTSRRMFDTLHSQFCTRSHAHTHIKGKTKIRGKWVNVSSFAKGYTLGFARKVAGCICCWADPESPLVIEEMILGLEEHDRPECQRHCSCRKDIGCMTSNQRHQCMGRHPLGRLFFVRLGIRLPGLATFILGKGSWL